MSFFTFYSVLKWFSTSSSSPVCLFSFFFGLCSDGLIIQIARRPNHWTRTRTRKWMNVSAWIKFQFIMLSMGVFMHRLIQRAERRENWINFEPIIRCLYTLVVSNFWHQILHVFIFSFTYRLTSHALRPFELWWILMVSLREW